MTQGLRLTESEGRQLLARHPGAVVGKSVAECLDAAERKQPKPKRGRMNKTETAMSMELESYRAQGVVTRWRFESVKLRLADNTWYTCDFQVWLPDNRILMLEVKGWLREHGGIRFKVARELYPEYIWLMYRREKGHWKRMFGEPIDVLIGIE